MGQTTPRTSPRTGAKAPAARPPLSVGHRVSVIVPYYNQPAYLAEAVSSIEQQTYPNIEIIVVDDGSPVPAASILSQGTGIQVIRTKNRGVSAARNFGFERCSGDYLIFL